MKKVSSVTLAVSLLASFAPVTSALAQVRPHKVTVIYRFTESDGRWPRGQLAEHDDGVFYGTTSLGGSRRGGTVFKITTAGELTTLFEFGEHSTAFEGSHPDAGLTKAPDGNFYGTTPHGGDLGSGIAGGSGTVFRVTPEGSLSVLQTFTGPNGAQPFAPLVRASDGNLYGITYSSSISAGSLFRVGMDGTVASIHEFPSDGSEGAQFIGGLVQGADGNLYGTGQSGGWGLIPNGGGGVLFRASLVGAVTPLHYFPYISTPNGVAFSASGELFGITTASTGTIYRIDATGAFDELHRFSCYCGTPDGASPSQPPILASDGLFYGTTAAGGIHYKGTIYSMTSGGVITPIHSFDESEGEGPSGRLVEGRDGRFYGTASGAFSGFGTVYKLAFAPVSAPNGFVAQAESGRVVLGWVSVKTTDSYDIYVGTASDSVAATPTLGGVTATSATVSGLTNGVNYYFRIAATNEAGSGPQSPPISAMPVTAPSSLQAIPGDGEITLSWTAAEGATTYNVYQSEFPITSAALPTRTGVTGTSAVFAGLTNGTIYYYKVASVYGAVVGATSTAITSSPKAPASGGSGGGGGGIDTLTLFALIGAFAIARTPRRCSGDGHCR